MKIKNLLLGMAYNMPKVHSSEFQNNSIKIEDLKMYSINPFNPIITKGGVKILKLLFLIISPRCLVLNFILVALKLRISKLTIKTINNFNPISTKAGSEHFKPISRNVLHYAKEVKFCISES